MTLELDTETEARIHELAEREQISTTQLIKKLLSTYSTSDAGIEDLFSCAGIWKDRDINQESIRANAWSHDSV